MQMNRNWYCDESEQLACCYLQQFTSVCTFAWLLQVSHYKKTDVRGSVGIAMKANIFVNCFLSCLPIDKGKFE